MTGRVRTLVLAGAALTVLSLGLPWGAYAGVPGYVTLGYYTAPYCDSYYCYSGSYQPGVFVPGYEGGVVSGTFSTARFFIVATLALALAGWHLSRRRLLQAAAGVAVAGIAFHLTSGLTGGAAALGIAAVCFWLVSRRRLPGLAPQH